MSREIEYEPVSAKETLSEMRDTAELLIDLSYSSVLFEDRALAEEVLRLESEMDLLQLQAWMSLVMAGRRPGEAERLAPVFGIVAAAEKISDAAGDIAKVVLESYGLPDSLRAVAPSVAQPPARAVVAPESPYCDQTLGELTLETDTGVRVLAVRRDDDWLVRPDRDTRLAAGDTVFCRGTESGVSVVYERLTGETLTRPESDDATVQDLDRAVETLVTMRNASELAVDLAYGSVLFDDMTLAEEVSELEVEVDTLQSRFEAWALRAAAELDDPVSVRGLLRIAASAELISDAALEISEGVLRGVDSHPVVEAAVAESDEVIVRTAVERGSSLAGRTLGEADVQTTTGMRVITLRRPAADDERYVLSPDATTTVEAGDVLIATGTRTSADRLTELTTR